MATSTDIKKRALELAAKTDINSINPQEVGGLFYDITGYGEEVQRNGGTLGIRKVYASVSAMEADSTSPVDMWGNPMRKGNLCVIYDGTQEGSDNNKVFAFKDPGWEIATHLDAGYATRGEVTDLEYFSKYISINGTLIGLDKSSNTNVSNKHFIISGHSYTLSIVHSNIGESLEEGRTLFGVFIKYKNEDTESNIILVNKNKSEILDKYVIETSLEYGEIEYIRIAINADYGEYLSYNLQDTTMSILFNKLDFKQVSYQNSGLYINKNDDNAVSLLSYINRVEVSFYDYVEKNILYKPDGSKRKIAFRNYGQVMSGSKRAILYKESDDGIMEHWIYINNVVQDNVFSGKSDGINVVLYTNGWSENMLNPLDSSTQIEFSLFEDKYKKQENEKLNSLIRDAELLNEESRINNGVLGDWEIRFNDLDGAVKNEDGSYNISLNSTSGNSALWIINKIPNDVRNKRVRFSFEAKSNSEVKKLYYNLNNTYTKYVELTEEWNKYVIDEYYGTSYEDNRLMLYKIASNPQLVFDIKNVSLLIYSGIDSILSEKIDSIRPIDSSSSDIITPLRNVQYKIAQLEMQEDVQCCIGLLGDSWTQHSGADITGGNHTNYVQPFAKYLREKYGDAGGGFYSFSCSHNGSAKMGCADPDDADDTRSSGSEITYRDQVEGCLGIDAADATFNIGAVINLNIKKPHDKLILHFYGVVGGGTFTYKLDDSEAVSVDSSTYNGHSTIEISTTDSTHTLQIEQITGSTTIFGVDLQKTSKGFRIYKIGNKGATTASYAITNSDSWESILKSFNLDALTTLLGTNDGENAGEIVQNNLSIILDRVNNVDKYIDKYIIMPSNNRLSDLSEQSIYQHKTAVAYNTGFINLIPLFGSSEQIIKKNTFFDSLHPTLFGGRMICNYLLNKLCL